MKTSTKKTTKLPVCIRCKERVTTKIVDPDADLVILPVVCDDCFEIWRRARWNPCKK